MNLPRLLVLALLAFVAVLTVSAAEKKAGKGAAGWEPAIQRFETQDKASPPPKGAILLVGGSNARRWTEVGSYFPGETVINRGFGGAQLADVLHFTNRIVLPYAPKVIFLNGGGNDLSAGKSPEAIRDTCREFVRQVSAALPKTKIYYISIPPVLRAAQAPQGMALIRRTNTLIAELAQTESALTFVDLFPRFLAADGQPKPELFVEDGTHFSSLGQAVVAELLKEKMKASR
jgi:lysophospholipase L1-like esterase